MKKFQVSFTSPVRLFSSWEKVRQKKFIRFLSIVLALAVLNLTGACNYFKVTTSSPVTSQTFPAMINAGKTIVIHFDTNKWILGQAMVTDSAITGSIKTYDRPATLKPVRADKPNRYIARASMNQSYLLGEVHIYADEVSFPQKDRITVPLNSVRELQLYEKDVAATVGTWVLAGLGSLGVAFGILIILVLLFKSSCPFIYTWDGESFRFAGEIYSGSIHKPLERHDFLKLPVYPGQSTYKLKIANEAREIQHTNLLELQIIDHPDHVEVLIDKYGNIRTLSNLTVPLKAVNLAGEDVASLVSAKDNLYYQGNVEKEVQPLTDGLILEFPNPQPAGSARLAIRAKNSVILDYAMGQLHNMFGSAYPFFMKKQQRATTEELVNLSLTQQIPLSLYVEREGSWEFIDYYPVAGPMAFKEDVLNISLTGKEGNPLRVKLEHGNLLWEIDYAAIDLTPEIQVKTYTVSPSAFDENGNEISDLLKQDDRKYYDQPGKENQAIVTFSLPESSDQSRTLILHSKGWYEILLDPKGKPDLAYLKTFREPGVFNQFTNDLVRNSGRLASHPSR